ncbi:hypothetical protein ACVS9P_08300 [Caproicibacterium sp. NSD3]
MYSSLPLLPHQRKEYPEAMIRISEPEDLEKKMIPFEIKEYLSKYLQTVLQNYGCNSLEKIGCIYYFETTEDTLNYSKMGLSYSLLETPFEYCEFISIKNSCGESNLLHGCYVFNNDYAIDFFGQDSIFDQQTLSTLRRNNFNVS